MNKKLKRLIVISLVILVIAGTGIVLKNIFLSQVKKKIQSALGYTQLRLSLFPPALIMDDVRTISPSPFFSAKKVSVKISFRSLLTREKPLDVFIDEPVMVIHATASGKTKEGVTKTLFPFPFVVRRGLIRGGELYYWGTGNNFCSTGIKALFTQKKDFISFQGEAEENIFSLGSSKKELRGKINLSFEGRGDELSIRNMRIYGSDFIFKAEGDLTNLRDPEISLKTYLRIETPLVIDFLDLPFDWDGKAEGTGLLTRKKGKITFSSNFFSDDLHLNKVPLGRVNGRIEMKEMTRGSVEFNIHKNLLPSEYLKIYFDKNTVNGIARGFHLDPVIKYTPLPWPIISPVWGDFIIEGGVLKVDAEFRDESFQALPKKFPFRGKVKFNYNLIDELTFSSEELLTSFAQVGVEGKVKLNDMVDVKIQGEVSDVKQAREFTSLILNKKFEFPEIRGKGTANLEIFGDYALPQIKAKFSVSPGGFAKFQVDSVEGQAEIIKKDFLGKFQVKDPFMEGKIDLVASQSGVRADIHLDRGNVEKILPALDISLPLSGRGSGDFEVRQQGEDVRVNGEFSGSSMEFVGQSMKNVSGKLVWEDNVLAFPELQFNFHGGEIKGYAQIGVLNEFFDLDVWGKNLDISFFNPGLKGSLSFGLKGKGSFGKDKAPGKFEIKDLLIYPFQKSEVKGEVKLGIKKDRFDLDIEGNFFPGENRFYVSLDLPFFQESSANIRGFFQNLDLLLPWRGAKGQINYLADLNGGRPSWKLKGVIDFKGSLLPLPKFAHAVRDYSGLVFVEDTRFSIRSFKGVLGEGDVWGSGEVKLGKKGVENIELRAQGKNMLLSPLERTRALGDGSLKLIKDRNRFDLEGDFLIQRLSWRRELNEKFVFYSTPYYQTRTEPGVFDDLNLNLRLRAKDNAWMENSLGRIEGKFDLKVAGNVKAPILTGDIEALQGNVYFQDRKFRILSGRVSFINPSAIEPYLEFKGETYVKDYRVTFSLDGLIDRLNPEFSSSPPLPPEDVLALLAMGEAFKRTYSYDRSTQLSTASLLSFQLAEEAKKRAEKLFRFDRFRIDPFLMGSSAETTARLTVGKKISRNFFILYSTNLSTQREELVRLEWELTADLSVVGIRDEKGRFSFDVKIHKRF